MTPEERTPSESAPMRYIIGLLLSLMLTCVASHSLAVAATSIEGSWIGSGTVSHRSNVDRVQCRVRYTKSSENSYATSSVCTTENGRFEVSGHLTNIGGNRYQGTVTSGNETGRVIMVHRGDRQSGTVTSPSGSATLTLSRRYSPNFYSSRKIAATAFVAALHAKVCG